MREPSDAIRSIQKYVGNALTPAATEDGELLDWEVRLSYERGTFRRPFCRIDTAGALSQSGPAHTAELAIPLSLMLHPIERSEPDAARLEAERIRSEVYAIFRDGAMVLPAPGSASVEGDDGALPSGAYSYAVTALSRYGESEPTRVELALPGTGGAHLTWPAVGGASRYRVYRGVVEGSEQLLAETDLLEHRDDGTGRLGAAVREHGRGTLGQPLRVPLWDWAGVPLIPEDGDPASATSTARGESDFLEVRDLSVDVVPAPEDELLLVAVCDMRVAWTRRRPDPEAATLSEIRVAFAV